MGISDDEAQQIGQHLKMSSVQVKASQRNVNIWCPPMRKKMYNNILL